MADDVWRRSGADEEDEFGPPLFGDESTGEVRDQSGGLSFGASDTGQLPHWTEPPTGEMPRTLATPVVDPAGEPDVWTTFSHEAPIWNDDPLGDDTGGAVRPEHHTGEVRARGTGEVAATPRREPGRITIGTDPTDDRTGRPMPRSRSRAGRDDPGARPGRPSSPGNGGGVRTGGTAGRDMPTAIAVGLLIAAAFIGAVLIGPWAVLVVVMVVVGLAAIEFFDKVSEKGYRPATIVGIFACVLAPLAAYHEGERALLLVLVLALAAGCATFASASGIESNPMPNMAITMLGVTWIGILGAYAAVIVRFSTFGGDNPIGTDTLLLLALGVVANDIGALFVGSIAGRTPLRSWISPNKSLEGLIGGTIATVGVMVLVGVADRSDTWNSTGDLIILGLVIAVMAPLGDFTESMFKRNLDVKDFGSIVRGHGGVLDRFDAFLFTLPAVYYLLLVLEPYAT